MSRVATQLKFFNKISSTTVEPQILLNAHKYSGLKLMFQQQNHNGHMGARKFWHEYLPTLQFYNPDLQFQVTRVKNEDKKDASVPCTLEILDKENAVVDSLDMRNKQGSEIMQELLEKLEHERVAEEDIVRL
ncbi:LANO_0G04368g1_1 [Lachancea nothofagi CBS 11611]|uniref:LANO_0G04368g1_1 n=1 Tax=Lachancea nothofagi CBS 11611 TaxID=1266666 RepID=A0A1G4KG34_9SACH|nr:LANO_0G04368g1_1 [Lachancea nothofagi CBS 11611]